MSPEEKALIDKRKRRRRKKIRDNIIITGILLIILAAIVFGIFSWVRSLFLKRSAAKEAAENEKAYIEKIISEADLLASGFDYDGAMKKLDLLMPDYSESDAVKAAMERYEKGRAELLPYSDIYSVTHIFFHTLILDSSLAFDGDYKEDGYNQYMTTVSEFKKILDEMYNKGYILVDIHDLAALSEQEDGSLKMTPKTLMLPEGKIPFVMSQDDVCYYTYMTGDGFASKIVVGEDGKPTCEYIKNDGTKLTGDYDLVPILESFIALHPDFSYRGARAILALTGYDGVLGYRTSPSCEGYSEEEVEKARLVADALKKCGYTFASHSWGHLKYKEVEYSRFAADVKRWNDEVVPIIGSTDVLIYANGADIAGIEYYSGDRYNLLKSYGFNYFCNVDAHKYWVQLGDGYLRQGRRNIDGYRMYYNPQMLSDLFSTDKIFDESRPVPVPPI